MAAALRRTGLIELGTRSLENSLTPRDSFQAQGRNTSNSVSLTRELNGARLFAPSIRRLAQARTQSVHPSHFVIAPLPLYLPLKSPIAILIIRLMYPKVDCTQKSTTIGPVRKVKERNERHIYIVSL